MHEQMFHIGQHISYVLLPKDCPTHPEHEYHGIITAVTPIQVRVVIINAECDGLEEWIYFSQIRSVEGSKIAEQSPTLDSA